RRRPDLRLRRQASVVEELAANDRRGVPSLRDVHTNERRCAVTELRGVLRSLPDLECVAYLVAVVVDGVEPTRQAAGGDLCEAVAAELLLRQDRQRRLNRIEAKDGRVGEQPRVRLEPLALVSVVLLVRHVLGHGNT